MKNNLLISFFVFLFTQISLADELDISAKNVTIDKDNNTITFKDNIKIVDIENNIIESDYAFYNKEKKFFTLKNNIIITDKFGNIYKGENATYDENLKILNSFGKTNITTKEGYIINSANIFLDNLAGKAKSSEETTIKDSENNLIKLTNFEYIADQNIFKSVGEISIIDKNKNFYEFSQIYIDEKKREIIGSDAKAFINQESFKTNKKNKPRVFSNAINFKNDKTKFIKSTFTTCDYRANDKCPPWELRATQMMHDKKKKTIYYDNAILKVYNIPIFYFPKLAHPDPSVKRRSGFLAPSLEDTKNLGSSISLPYYWALNEDKDFTLTGRIFTSEHPLYRGEYRQVFNNSNLFFDLGFTRGYKKTTSNKKAGEKSHFFGNFLKNFATKDGTEANLEINIENVSNKKYLKLYRIESNLVDYNAENLENTIDFKYFNDNDNFYLASKVSSYRSLKDTYNDKYENIFPEITLSKNLLSEKYGYGNLNSSFKILNYDTNKFEKYLTNDLDWKYNLRKNSWLNSSILGLVKNVNYDYQNIDSFKEETTNELFGAIGYLTSVDMQKSNVKSKSFLTPKMLFRYAPNHMKNEKNNEFVLRGKNIFSLDRLQSPVNFESGANLTLGIDYQKNIENNQINFSIGQIINEKKENIKMPNSSSLNKRFSDMIGSFNFKNENLKIDYNYTVDRNYNEINYNEINAYYDVGKVKFNLNYLDEDKNTGENEYIKSAFEIKRGENGLLKLSNKRNLVTNSSEFYDLSYEYINDCLRAGIVYRREFYNDSELEAENSILFTLTLSDLTSINTPSFSK